MPRPARSSRAQRRLTRCQNRRRIGRGRSRAPRKRSGVPSFGSLPRRSAREGAPSPCRSRCPLHLEANGHLPRGRSQGDAPGSVPGRHFFDGSPREGVPAGGESRVQHRRGWASVQRKHRGWSGIRSTGGPVVGARAGAHRPPQQEVGSPHRDWPDGLPCRSTERPSHFCDEYATRMPPRRRTAVTWSLYPQACPGTSRPRSEAARGSPTRRPRLGGPNAQLRSQPRGRRCDPHRRSSSHQALSAGFPEPGRLA